jgi:hypothetical protein
MRRVDPEQSLIEDGQGSEQTLTEARRLSPLAESAREKFFQTSLPIGHPEPGEGSAPGKVSLLEQGVVSKSESQRALILRLRHHASVLAPLRMTDF